MEIKPREPGLILVFSIISCGFYLIYWYYKMYEELEHIGGNTPTGRSFGLDFFLNLITCGLYGIWVDYRISIQLRDLQASRGFQFPNDTSMLAIILDISAYFTGYFTNFISSAIHQDLLNKIIQADQQAWQAQQQAAWQGQQQPPMPQPPPQQQGGPPPSY